MDYDSNSNELLVLSSNNVVSFRDPATLVADREVALSFNAIDLVISSDHNVLLIASGTDRTVQQFQLPELQPLNPISIGLETPVQIEALPGAPTGFVVLTKGSTQGYTYTARVFNRGTNIAVFSGITSAAHSVTNVMLFDTQRNRLDLHVKQDGTLFQQFGPDDSVFRPGSAFTQDFTVNYTVYSSIGDGPRPFLFCGYSPIQCFVQGPYFNFSIPPVTLNLPGPGTDPVRWGEDGFALLGAGSVISFRSSIAGAGLPADISISQQGLSGVTDRSPGIQLTVVNHGPGPATDVRAQFQPPFPSRVPNFTAITNVVVSKGTPQIQRFKYWVDWYVPRLEPGESATAMIFVESPGVGVCDYKLTAIANEIDPAPEDSYIIAPYEVSTDPARYDFLKTVITPIWGANRPMTLYLPDLDECGGLAQGGLHSLNPRTGITGFRGPLSPLSSRLFVNEENPSTFLGVGTNYTLFSADTLNPVWTVPRDPVDGYNGDTIDVSSMLLFAGSVTNIVATGPRAAWQPPPTNTLVLYTGGIFNTNTLEGGTQLLRTGPLSFLSYHANKHFLHSLSIAPTGMVLKASWTNLITGARIDFKNDTVYSADGRTYAFPSMQAGPTFAGIQNPQAVLVLPKNDRAVFLMDGKVGIYELSTRQLLGSVISTNFVWNYPENQRCIDFAPPDVLFFSSTTTPVIMRSSLLGGPPLSIVATAQALKLSFFGRSGKTYRIQSTAELPTASWNTEELLAGANATIERTYDFTPASRFFRFLQE